MKRILLKAFLSVSIVFPQFLHARGGIGSTGGGFVVVCRDNFQEIKSIQLLDLYEAQLRGKQVLAPISEDPFEEYATYLTKLYRQLNIPEIVRPETIRNFQNEVALLYTFLGKGSILSEVSDSGPLPQLPQGCKLEQIAVFHFDQNRRIEVLRELWDKLDSVNQAALFVHEIANYNYRIKSSETTSLLARRFVGDMFSEEELNPVFEGIPDSALLCEAKGKDNIHRSQFYVYPDSTQPDTTSIVQFVSVVSREVFQKTTVRLPFQVKPEFFHLKKLKDSTLWYQEIQDPQANLLASEKLDGAFWDYDLNLEYRIGHPFRLNLTNGKGESSEIHYVTSCKKQSQNHKEKKLVNKNFGEVKFLNSAGHQVLDSFVDRKTSTDFSVNMTRDFQFGWIGENSPAECTQSQSHSMRIEIRGEPYRRISITPFGSPKLTLDALRQPSARQQILVSSIQVTPEANIILDADGFGVVDVVACREKSRSDQEVGFYTMRNFNVAFQYLSP